MSQEPHFSGTLRKRETSHEEEVADNQPPHHGHIWPTRVSAMMLAEGGVLELRIPAEHLRELTDSAEEGLVVHIIADHDAEPE